VVDIGRSVPELRPTHRRRRRTVTVEKGLPAIFVITHSDGIGFSRCRFILTHGLRVRLPHAGRSRFVAYQMEYCPPPQGGLGLQVGRIE
jgi:hypothetical protein